MISPSRCTLAKATDQHHERAAARLATRPQGEVLLDGLSMINFMTISLIIICFQVNNRASDRNIQL